MGLKEIIIRRTLWKGVRRGIQVLVAAIASSKLKQYGVEVDEIQATAALTGLSEAGLNILKQRFPSQLGWL